MSGSRQHIVPQQMIRRFANNKGKLFELYKSDLSINRRPRSPKGILFHDEYYKDKITDFDEVVLRPVEQKFASHYAEIADKPWQRKTWPAEIGAAFINWVASQLCRTRFLIEMSREIIKQVDPILINAYKTDPKLINNILRYQMFSSYQDFLSRPRWKWKCLIISTQSNLIISDHPVCYALGFEKGRKALLVPLSKKRILFGGTAETIEKCCQLSVREINFSLAAWSERHVFAADKKTLQHLAADLYGTGIISGPSEVLEAARKPFFGLSERIHTNPVPKNVDVNKFWKSLKDSFGPSIIK
jgi:Protein of unknown function (DUF4238)